MKLIDLLVSELPKRGGWPEGVDRIVQDYDGEVKGLNKPTKLRFSGEVWERTHQGSNNLKPFHAVVCSDFNIAIVTREQYQYALAASQKAAWSGDGLPPAGCECEWQDKNTKQWQPVKVVYASEWVTVIREINKEKGNDLVEIAIENYGDDARLKFRPIRSEADKKRDVAAKEMARHANDDENRMFDAGLRNCLSIYNAIAAGKIPGVKLED